MADAAKRALSGPDNYRQGRLDGRTLDDAISEAHGIVDRAIAEHGDWPRLALFSGGNDSTVLLHLMRDRVQRAVHANTGIGIEQTREYVRWLCADWQIPLLEVHPPEHAAARTAWALGAVCG